MFACLVVMAWQRKSRFVRQRVVRTLMCAILHTTEPALIWSCPVEHLLQLHGSGRDHDLRPMLGWSVRASLACAVKPWTDMSGVLYLITQPTTNLVASRHSKHWLVNSLFFDLHHPANMSRGGRVLSAVVVAFAVWVALLQYVEGDVFTRILLVRCTRLLYSIFLQRRACC